MAAKGPRALPLATQAHLLGRTWPGSRVKTKCDELTWIGGLRPTTASPQYTVVLRYRHRRFGRPVVSVIDPPLDAGHRQHLPHVYAHDDLCLYSLGDWNWSMPLATTIVPWASEWLFHYEAWLVTGTWRGGGDPYYATARVPPSGGERCRDRIPVP
jgi:hypothetical protein